VFIYIWIRFGHVSYHFHGEIIESFSNTSIRHFWKQIFRPFASILLYSECSFCKVSFATFVQMAYGDFRGTTLHSWPEQCFSGHLGISWVGVAKKRWLRFHLKSDWPINMKLYFRKTEDLGSNFLIWSLLNVAYLFYAVKCYALAPNKRI